MRLVATVGERLIEREVRERQTAQRRMLIVAGVETDGTVEDIDAVTSESAAQRQKSCRRVTKHAWFAPIVFVKVHVARPEQRLRRAVAWVLAVVQARMNIERVIILVVERQGSKEIQVLRGNAPGDRGAGFAEFLFGSGE